MPSHLRTLRPRKAPKRVLSVVETGFIAALVIALVSRMTILAHDSDKLAHLNGTSPIHVYPEANHSLPIDVDDDLTVAHHHHHHVPDDDDDAIDDDAPSEKKSSGKKKKKEAVVDDDDDDDK